MKINDPKPKSYTLPHPIWSQEELEGVQITHDPPKDKTETVREKGDRRKGEREGGGETQRERERVGERERERVGVEGKEFTLISWFYPPGLLLCREDVEICL